MELDLFTLNEKLTEDKLHEKFKYLRDEITLSGERDILIGWTNGFRDRDNKIVKEFQTTFHSSLWEFFLFAFFKEAGLKLNQKHNRPDFLIEKPYNINVEAVTSNIRQDGTKENRRTAKDVSSMFIPPYLQNDFNDVVDEAIVRYSNSITKKNNKFINEYCKQKHIKEEDPFIIALGSYDQINYGREYIYPMIGLLYGKYYNPQLDIYENKDKILKPGTNSNIDIGIFNDDKYKNISAIIFSCTVTFGKLTSLAISKNKIYNLNTVYNLRQDFEDNNCPYKLQIVSYQNPEFLSEGVFIFHNPKAKNKLPMDVFSSTNATQVWLENDTIKLTPNTKPIVARMNIPTVLRDVHLGDIQENIRLYNRKKLSEFYNKD